MSRFDEDLAGLFSPSILARPTGAAQPMAYRQGKVLTWDPVTLENTIDVGGSVLTNIPVLGVAEATSITAGSVVGMMVVGPTWAIIGRLVVPGTTQATDAITLLSSKTSTDYAAGSVHRTTQIGWGAESDGPSVTVNVGASGRLLITLGAYCALQITSDIPAYGHMGFVLVGANTRAEDDERAFTVEGTAGLAINGSRTMLIEGLDPGETTVWASYYHPSDNNQTLWSNRDMVVIAL